MKASVKLFGKFTASLCFVVAFISFLILARDIFDTTVSISVIRRFVSSCGIAVFLMIGGVLFYYCQDRAKRNRRVLNYTVFAVFFFYLFQLVLLLFLDQQYRDLHNELSTYEYFLAHHNFVPFATIKNYFQAYRYNNEYLNLLITNVVGNLIAFIPFGLIVPFLSPALRNIKRFVGVLLLSLVLVEGMQIVLNVGSFDVDDIILNFIGGFLAYLLFLFVLKMRRYWQKTRTLKSYLEIKDLDVIEKWQAYLAEHGDENVKLSYLGISAQEEELIIGGKKSAFSSPYNSFNDKKLMPLVGEYTLLSRKKKYITIVKTTEVRLLPYEQITKRLIQQDGYENKKTWESVFKQKYHETCKEKFHPKVTVVFEFFEEVVTLRKGS